MRRKGTRTIVERMARECVANQLRTLTRVVTGIYEEQLRPLKLKASQMVILAITEKRGQVRAAELSLMLHVDASTLSRNLERMRARGWLEEARGGDERSRPFRLTASGKKILREAFLAWERAQESAVGLLGREGVANLHHLTEKVKTAASADRKGSSR